jgi:TonB family protein
MFPRSPAIVIGLSLAFAGSAPAVAGQTLTLHRVNGGTSLRPAMMGDVGDAKVIDFVAPQPQGAAPATGSVSVEIDIDASGKLTACRVLRTSGDRGLDERTLRALQAARYLPARRHGRSIAGAYAVSIGFDVDDDS